jgi:hypothetical protein
MILKGKPRSEENPYFIAKKETKSVLRKAIKINIIETNIKENNSMMKLFAKLVNSQGYTAMLTVDGDEYHGDAQVLHIS